MSDIQMVPLSSKKHILDLEMIGKTSGSTYTDFSVHSVLVNPITHPHLLASFVKE